MSNNTNKSNDGSILNSYYKLHVYLFKIIYSDLNVHCSECVMVCSISLMLFHFQLMKKLDKITEYLGKSV